MASVNCYFHKVTLSVEDCWTVETLAGFIENFAMGALLGRRGFFDNFTVKFDHSSFPPTLEVDRIVRVG